MLWGMVRFVGKPCSWGRYALSASHALWDGMLCRRAVLGGAERFAGKPCSAGRPWLLAYCALGSRMASAHQACSLTACRQDMLLEKIGAATVEGSALTCEAGEPGVDERQALLSIDRSAAKRKAGQLGAKDTGAKVRRT
eukprot:365558-Chlamydomonas_euryale.AAC.17